MGTHSEMLYNSSMEDVEVKGNGDGLTVAYKDAKGEPAEIEADMVILSTAMVPDGATAALAEVMGIDRDERGFFLTLDDDVFSVASSREGIYIAGTAEGPKDSQTAVVQAEAAVGKALAFLETLKPAAAEAAAESKG